METLVDTRISQTQQLRISLIIKFRELTPPHASFQFDQIS